jgi:hypothetical protein
MNQLEYHIENQNYQGFITSSLNILKNEETFEACKQICEVLLNCYQTDNAKLIVEILESIFSENPEIVDNLKKVENPLLLLCVFTGSEEIYKWYCKCILDPLISQLDEFEVSDYYMKLYTYFEKTNEILFDNYLPMIPDIDWIGINAINAILFEPEYNKIKAIIENYNKIIGRRIIFKDISERYENC